VTDSTSMPNYWWKFAVQK